jgi:hypothetical protein
LICKIYLEPTARPLFAPNLSLPYSGRAQDACAHDLAGGIPIWQGPARGSADLECPESNRDRRSARCRKHEWLRTDGDSDDPSIKVAHANPARPPAVYEAGGKSATSTPPRSPAPPAAWQASSSVPPQRRRPRRAADPQGVYGIAGRSTGGDRRLNRALYTVALTRLGHDPRTRDYLARRTAEGSTRRETTRVLKRYISRELFRLLTATQPRLIAP